MFFIRLIKNSKYFYSAMAATFIIFVILILLTGKEIYSHQKQELFSSKTNELLLTKRNFENRLDDVEIELRRIVNIMKQVNLLKNPNEIMIQSFVSDFLFDHSYLSIIITDMYKQPLIRINSQTFPDSHADFAEKDPQALMTAVNSDDYALNKIQISAELDTVYLVKTITSEVGRTENYITFFFAPEFLLKQIPANYAFLVKGGGVQWVPDNGKFPVDFVMPVNPGRENHISVNDTRTVFYAPLSDKNANYMLAAVTDTSQIKQNLLYSTTITLVVFSIFFILLLLLIYFRNLQISQLINTQKATVVCLANLAEFKDNETADHLERTRHYGTLLAAQLRRLPRYKNMISKDYMDNIGFASVLHDIGKVGIPDEILKKPGKLTPDEFEIIKQHTVFAKAILKELVDKHKINDIFFTLSYNIAAYHHEKWDGSGYPHGISGEAIPLEARIFAICDVYDALRSERVYKDAFPHSKAMEIINSGCGTHFDPNLVEEFNRCAEQFRQIHDTYTMFYKDISYSDFGNNRRELKVEWNPGLSVGIDHIDDQHKILLSKINLLIKSILEGKGDESILSILNFLRNYSDEHFLAEEKIMEELNHPDLAVHKKAHDLFRKNFEKIISQISATGMNENTLIDIEKYLISWLLDHIAEMDVNIKTPV